MSQVKNPYRGMPRAVRIGCFLFDLYVPTEFDHDVTGTYGLMSPPHKRISLRPGMSGQELANTFLHEVIHGIHLVYGLMRGGEDEVEPSEEEYTTLTANGLCAFWQDNPEACKWWTSIVRIEK